MTDPPTSQSRRSLLQALSNMSTSQSDSSVQAGSGGKFGKIPPSAGDTIRLSTRAMACDFSVIMNPGTTDRIQIAGEALESIHAIEALLSIYKPSSCLSELNRMTPGRPQVIRGDVFEVLELAEDLFHKTDGAFDMAAGSLSQHWKRCREAKRIPDRSEIEAVLESSGMQHVELRKGSNEVEFRRAGIILDPGAIGKGYALDEATRALSESEIGLESFLLHGGHSSLRAVGEHNGFPGWPVGLGNPLFTEKRLGTLLLCEAAMATSGSNIQFFRHEGKRYGHILDPRTGWPVDGMLSVTVLAPSAAVADALATAFFVMGVEKAVSYCENWAEIGAILIPFPVQGRKVQPTVIGIPPELIVWDADQVCLSES